MIRFESVSAGYPGREVVKSVSFTVPRGSVTALVGPNGCGKTTLLKTACGLIRPTGGEVWVDGRSVSGYRRRELARQVAMLPQSREVPAVTVERLAAYGRYPHLGIGRGLSARDRELVEAALEAAGIQALRHRELGKLSGGERQRAYIAMAVAQDSECLLLDEPTTYLDIGQKNQVMALVQKLNTQGKTVLAVLHDLPLAFAYSDFVAVMEGGELNAFGSPKEVSAAAAEVFGVREARVELDGEEQTIFF